MTLFDKIIALLDSHDVDYVLKEHPPTPTSEDSARERGEPIKIGAKALLVKGKEGFVLCVIPADKRLDAKKVKRIIGKKMRFASKEELMSVTGLVPGAVPPFGELMGVDMLVDPALFDEEKMAFNAGSLVKSIIMKSSEYKRVVKPKEMPLSL